MVNLWLPVLCLITIVPAWPVQKENTFLSTQSFLIIMKRNYACRLLTCLGWTAALGLTECIAPVVATSATVTPMDEPPCYIRTQDGSLVNLQSLCGRTIPQQTQASPATNRQPQGIVIPQTVPTQRTAPLLPQRDPSGSHAHGNPDSDDGNY